MSSSEPQQRKLRVLVDVHDLRVASTGIRTYIQELLKALNFIGADKVEVETYPEIDSVNNQFFGGNSKWRAPLFHLFTVYWKHIAIPLKVRRYKADILLAPDFYAPIWKLRAKKIVVFHDAFFWESPKHYNPLWGAYFRRMIIWGLRGKSSVLTVSETSKERLVPFLPADVPIDVARTSIDFSEAPSVQASREGTPYFLHVGVFEKRKNLTTVIKAFHLFRQQVKGDAPRLILIGNQYPRPTLSDREAIMETIAAEGLQESVECLGYLPLEEVWQYYKGALGYVLPSVNEGFGLPLLEAFHAKLPVIISDIDVLREIGGEAVLVAKGDDPSEWSRMMLRIYSDSSLRTELIEKGEHRLKEFTLSNFARQLESVLFT